MAYVPLLCSLNSPKRKVLAFLGLTNELATQLDLACQSYFSSNLVLTPTAQWAGVPSYWKKRPRRTTWGQRNLFCISRYDLAVTESSKFKVKSDPPKLLHATSLLQALSCWPEFVSAGLTRPTRFNYDGWMCRLTWIDSRQTRWSCFKTVILVKFFQHGLIKLNSSVKVVFAEMLHLSCMISLKASLNYETMKIWSAHFHGKRVLPNRRIAGFFQGFVDRFHNFFCNDQ